MEMNDSAPLLQPNQLLPGDIIIQYGQTPDHSLMWVGGDRPLVHSTDSSSTSGILRQTNKIYDADVDESSTPVAEVYRCRTPRLAARAAEIAIRFAVSSAEPRYIQAKVNKKPTHLKTKFSQDRLGGDGGIWGPEAFVRAVRAYYRSRYTFVLSADEGVTCSQFITYAYQAAAIDLLASRHRPTQLAIELAAEAGLLGNLKIHGLSPLEGLSVVGRSYNALRPIKSGVDMTVPQTMRVNACITSVDRLTGDLKGKGDFVHLGNLCGDND